MAINEYHLSKESVSTFGLADDAVTRAKTDEQFIQSGSAACTFAFAATGVETQTASVTFGTAFPSGVTPKVVFSPKDNQPVTLAVTSISNTGFTLTAKDELGTDLTASITIDIDYIAIAP